MKEEDFLSKPNFFKISEKKQSRGVYKEIQYYKITNKQGFSLKIPVFGKLKEEIIYYQELK